MRFAYLDGAQGCKLLRLSVSRLATVHMHVCARTDLETTWPGMGLGTPCANSGLETICPEMGLEPICHKMDLGTIWPGLGLRPYVPNRFVNPSS